VLAPKFLVEYLFRPSLLVLEFKNLTFLDMRLHTWSLELASAFHHINAQWIEAMFTLEETDRHVLENPQSLIIDKGGDILFVEAAGLGIVGACALMPSKDEGVFELTKMGVLESARGLKAGEYLLNAVLAKAAAMNIKTLFLLTNKRCEAAIHLYEKLGFAHDEAIMNRYGARYQRCDVAMVYTRKLSM
jgi:N-acetylglutamate synthase-like GNAT family acetyltransferase